MKVRDAVEADIEAVLAIYNEVIATSTAVTWTIRRRSTNGSTGGALRHGGYPVPIADRGKHRTPRHPYGIIDAEMTVEDYEERVARLTGSTPPGPLMYLSCTQPLIYERDRVAEMVRWHLLQYLIFDSVAFLCHDTSVGIAIVFGLGV